jgi:hypothetical protein
MKEIQLTQGQVALVDDDDFESVNKYKWYAYYDKRWDVYYAQRKENKKTIRMHRVIFGITNSKVHIDHIDHNGTNNQRYNLRICLGSENQINRRKWAGSSKYKGVCFFRRDLKWFAYITSEGQQIHLGSFDNEIDAAFAYDNASKRLHGKCALLNFTSCSSLDNNCTDNTLC